MDNFLDNSNNQRSEIVLVTPEMARDFLLKSKLLGGPQRETQQNRVALYVGKMRRGEWILTPTAAIGISADGNIVDGKHRLTAVELSGCTIPMWIARQVALSAFEVLDQGLPRTLTQVAQMKGLDWSSNPNLAATNMAIVKPMAPFAARLHRLDLASYEIFMNRYKGHYNIAFPRYRGSAALSLAGLRGAVLRASISQPSEQKNISLFLKSCLCNDEIVDSKLMLAKTLVQAIAELKAIGMGARYQFLTYKASTKALHTFLTGTPKTKKWISNSASLRRIILDMVPIEGQSQQDLFPTEFDNWDPRVESAATYFGRLDSSRFAA